MRYYIRNQILDLLPTIWDGVKYARKANTDVQSAGTMLSDCFSALETVGQVLESNLSARRFEFYSCIIADLKEMLEGINSPNTAQKFKEQLKYLKRALQSEEEVKLEVLFLPYKFSMWDSMESIWKAASEDPRCDCYVMPVPYYERGSNNNNEFCYEGGQFPEDVRVTHYSEYGIDARRPDIIYIHNPYDANNKVTMVAEPYHSHNLKQYTDMLVYVPYFIAGGYLSVEQASLKCVTSGAANSSRVIVQSEVLRDIYIKCGFSPKKIIALGSPKIDAVLKNIRNPKPLPPEWGKKINGNRVILLNSSIGKLLKDPAYILKLKENISTIMNKKGITLIWRPHPLLEATIKFIRPDFLSGYCDIKNMILASANSILDENGDSSFAVTASDAMISDGSSLIRTYIMTEKPILVMESSSEAKHWALLSSDIYSCYFYNDGTTVDKFLDMVLSGEDPLRKERIGNYKKSLINVDGSCGEKIHKYIIGEVLR